ncbi:unnamed protein product [Cyclocybe aegerita]|uniref:DUF6534 domain-containing protein n=1 Tax=Cyclocybe aegerita TaxID=1973307 RepID=A0A8S0X2N9_CYCAE|nr:unnamed protein product [Cyclocybe aegerita]
MTARPHPSDCSFTEEALAKQRAKITNRATFKLVPVNGAQRVMDTPEFNVHRTLGALNVGAIVSCFLFGVATVQGYLYYTRYQRDRRMLKALVAFVCHFGNVDAMLRPPGSLYLAVILSGLIAPVVQMFFAERLRVVSGGRVLIPLICWTLSLVRFAMSLVTGIKAYRLTTIWEFTAEWKWLMTTLLCIGAAVDILVAVSLCYYLREKRDQSGRETRMKIQKVMMWSIETGLVTSVAGITIVICFLEMPTNLSWLAIFMVMARLFSNSLFASLNARIFIRPEYPPESDMMFGTTASRPQHETTPSIPEFQADPYRKMFEARP